MDAKDMTLFKKCPLFQGLDEDQIRKLMTYKDVKILKRQAEEYVFSRGDVPEALFVLLSGKISVEKVDLNGKRSVVNVFREAGTVFAEVYLYLATHEYDYDCRCLEETRALSLPRYLFDSQADHDGILARLHRNMLQILSQKAFYLNQKVLVLSSFTLRQKIASYLLQQSGNKESVHLPLKREDLADYLGTARPSLSRELTSMEADGLIRVNRDEITLCDPGALQELT